MNLYFVKATYTNNVYKLSDFYTGDNYIQNAMKMLSMVFKADDGVSSLIVPNKLPDNTDVRNYTHIMIPELNKIYRIVACDYWNTDQYQLTLDDDPLIANYVEFKTKNIILNRSNDTSLFKGVHDVSEIIMKKKTTILKSSNDSTQTDLCGWVALFFQSDVTGLQLTFKTENLTIELFNDTTDMILKYPQVSTKHPDTYEYFLKVVAVPNTLTYYQCIYNPVTEFLYWAVKDFQLEKTISITGAKYRSNESDVNNIIVTLPLRSDLRYQAGAKEVRLMCYQDLIGINKPDQLVDIKFIPDQAIPYKSVTSTFDSGTRISITKFESDFTAIDSILETGVYYGCIGFHKLNNVINLSRTATTTPLDFVPFKKYYIQVFGQRYVVNPRYHDKLKMYMNINSDVINYIIYYDNKENIIASGSFTHQAKWYVDKLDRFYNQNPTYKEQFYLKMAVDSMKTIAGGAIGGSVIPGIGTLYGAAAGLGGAVLDAGLSQVNLNIQEKSLRLQPDQINGNNSDISTQLANIFGIFWILEEPENTLDGLTQMKNEYFLRGFPTSYLTTLTTLTAASNDLFTSCKIVYGEIKEVVKNEYVTGYINAKLQNGVIFI